MADWMVSPGDRELDRALSDLAGSLAYPPTPDIASGVRRRLASQRARPGAFARLLGLSLQRRLALALLVLIALAAAVVAASPEARTAIAERLGLRGVQIQQGPTVPTPAGTGLNLGQSMTLEQARARVTFAVQVPTALSSPDEVYLLDVPPAGQVALVYRPRPDVPQAASTGVGLLLTEFQGAVSGGVIGKGLNPGTSLQDIQVNGGRGYWIDGDPHTFFYVDARGQVRTETTRLAGSVLLWEHGELTLRLESGLSKDAALRIAASAQ